MRSSDSPGSSIRQYRMGDQDDGGRPLQQSREMHRRVTGPLTQPPTLLVLGLLLAGPLITRGLEDSCVTDCSGINSLGGSSEELACVTTGTGVLSNVTWTVSDFFGAYEDRKITYDGRTALCSATNLCISSVQTSDEAIYKCSYHLDGVPFQSVNSICLYVAATPTYVSNTDEVVTVGRNGSAVLDTRIVYENGGLCGLKQVIDRFQLRHNDCSLGDLVYSCIEPNCLSSDGVEVLRTGEEDYAFQLRLTDLRGTDTNLTLCGHLDIRNSDGLASSLTKMFVVLPNTTDCRMRQEVCGSNEHCSSTSAGYRCVCKEGFYQVREGICIDIDECLSEYQLCGVNALCANYHGGYECLCDDGYADNGQGLCEDIDECQIKGLCGVNAQCNNTHGGYECLCDDGYADSGQGLCEVVQDGDELVLVISLAILAAIVIILMAVVVLLLVVIKRQRSAILAVTDLSSSTSEEKVNL